MENNHSKNRTFNPNRIRNPKRIEEIIRFRSNEVYTKFYSISEHYSLNAFDLKSLVNYKQLMKSYFLDTKKLMKQYFKVMGIKKINKHSEIMKNYLYIYHDNKAIINILENKIKIKP
ncbi:MAG: hypothetical protein WCX73_04500 [Candidatus Pacearchaeota archaeon]